MNSKSSVLALALFAPLFLFSERSFGQTHCAQSATLTPRSKVTSQNTKPAKVMEIRRLLGVMRVNEIMRPIINQYFRAIRKDLPDVPEKMWDELEKQVISDVDSGSFLELVIPVYDKVFTAGEIRQLIAFYKSPLGKKLTNRTPELTGEVGAVGERWINDVLSRVQKRLHEQGYSIKAKGSGQ